MRDKVRILTENGQAQHWGGALSRDWMAMFPETTSVLYINGHVQGYSGSQTELPRHYGAPAAVVPRCHHRLLGECREHPTVMHIT